MDRYVKQLDEYKAAQRALATAVRRGGDNHLAVLEATQAVERAAQRLPRHLR